MRAVVYHGPGKKAWEEVPDPVIVDPTDVIVRIDTTTICGTDLHILKGDVPSPANPPKGCNFCTRCPKVMPVCREIEPKLAEAAPGRMVACHLINPIPSTG